MANEKRLIDANELDSKLDALAKKYAAQGRFEVAKDYSFVQTVLLSAPTVDAVEVVRIEEVKQEILQGFDVLIKEYRHISQSSKDHFGIKADAMEIARRLVNAALTDLCTAVGAKMDGVE